MKTNSTRAVSSVLILVGAVIGATHAQSPATTIVADPPKPSAIKAGPSKAVKDQPAKAENSLEAVELRSDSRVFQMLGPGSQSAIQMSERFKDPEQRAALRAEHRAQIVESHQDVGQVLQLDAATESKLIELLTDVQMAQQEQFFRSAAERTSRADPWEPLYEQADRADKRIQALRELLGQEKLERYQAYSEYANERREVAKLDARLDRAHKLTIEQKQRLAELQREHITREIENGKFARYSRLPLSFSRAFQQMPSREELQRDSQLQTIAANEESWRRMPQSHEQLRQRAADFLTPTQLQTLAQMQAEKADSLRQWIENARVQAGLSSEIPDQPEVSQQPPTPSPLSGQVKVSIKIKVNRGEPIYFSHVGSNGEPVTFAGGEGLLVEAKPTIYDNDMYDLQVFYYEQGAAGKRVLGRGGSMGAVSQARADAASGLFSGSGGNVVTGANKSYAIELSGHAEPM